MRRAPVICVLAFLLAPCASHDLERLCVNKTSLSLNILEPAFPGIQYFTRHVVARVEWHFPSMSGDLKTLGHFIPGLCEGVHDRTEISGSTSLTLRMLVFHESSFSHGDLLSLLTTRSLADAVTVDASFELGSPVKVTFYSTEYSCAEMWPNVVTLDSYRQRVAADDTWLRIETLSAGTRCSSNVSVQHPTIACEQRRLDYARVTSAHVALVQDRCVPKGNVSVDDYPKPDGWSLDCTMVRSPGFIFI